MAIQTVASSTPPQGVATAAHLFNGTCETDEELDYLTADAAQLFDVPIAMVNLVCSDRLIFKSCVGNTQGSGMERKGSFCSLAAHRNDTLYIPNTLKDARFKNYHLVTGSANIRAYLGVPLKAADGSVVGTFCIMDTKPRKFAKQQVNLLKIMAAAAEAHIDSLHIK